MIGVGARYGIIKSGIPGMPAISVQAVYNQLNVSAGDNKFSANTISVAGVVSLNLPVVTPYAGLGFDTTKVTPDSDITDAEGSASGIRLEGGVNLSLVPLTYLQLGASLVNSDMGYTLGLGVKF
jgi:opacity protein-like surface antigen